MPGAEGAEVVADWIEVWDGLGFGGRRVRDYKKEFLGQHIVEPKGGLMWLQQTYHGAERVEIERRQCYRAFFYGNSVPLDMRKPVSLKLKATAEKLPALCGS